MASRFARGLCPVCDEEKTVIEGIIPDEDGTPRVKQIIRRHKATKLEWADRETWYCLGSRGIPTEITQEAA